MSLTYLRAIPCHVAAILLLSILVLPVEAQKCAGGQVLYLQTGSQAHELTAVGCRLDSPGKEPACSTAPPNQRVRYPSQSDGACHFCLQSTSIQDYGTPLELLERGASGLFRLMGRGGHPYPVDLDCLDDPKWNCTNTMAFYNCKAAADFNEWNIGAWMFDYNFEELWTGGQGASSRPPGFSAGVRNAGVKFTGASQYLEVPDDEILLDWIADGDFSVDGWIRTTSKGTQVVASKRVGSGGASSPGGHWWVNENPDLFHVGEQSLLQWRYIEDRDWDCTCPASGYCGLQIITAGGRLGIQLSYAGKWFNFIPESTPIIADGDWHHFAITVDRSETDGIVFYIDGSAVDEKKNPTRFSGCLSNDASLFIGGQSAASSFGFIGELDELNFYAVVLERTEVEAAYEAENQGYSYPRW